MECYLHPNNYCMIAGTLLPYSDVSVGGIGPYLTVNEAIIKKYVGLTCPHRCNATFSARCPENHYDR